MINLTDFERSASDCSSLICVYLSWSTKLRVVLTSFSKFFKQFKRIPPQSSLSKASLNMSHSSLTLEAEVVSLSIFDSSDVLEPSLKSLFFDYSKYFAILSMPSILLVKQ